TAIQLPEKPLSWRNRKAVAASAITIVMAVLTALFISPRSVQQSFPAPTSMSWPECVEAWMAGSSPAMGAEVQHRRALLLADRCGWCLLFKTRMHKNPMLGGN